MPKKIDLIAKALEGNYRKEHLLALKQAHAAYEFFHQQVYECEQAIHQTLSQIQTQEPPIETNQLQKMENSTSLSNKGTLKKGHNRSPYYFEASKEIKKITTTDLTTIPGIDANTAMKILSEIGTDMSRWRSGKAFVSWLGLCPGNKVSGGKVLSSKTKPSDNKVAQALRMGASTLYRSKCYLGAFFRRMRARLGAPKAITATAHKLAKILYCMLTTGEDYRELGENYYEQKYQARALASLKKRAKEMGYDLIALEV